MTDLVVFVEEPSAKIIVDGIVGRLAPRRRAIIVQHEGKSDLRRSFPRKIGSWRHPDNVPFIVLHDNDGGDCRKLKRELVELVPAGRRDRTIVRIVVQSLECWYLGDLPALETAGLLNRGAHARLAKSAKFRNPDTLSNAKQEFYRLHDETGQLALARQIAPHLSLSSNKSRSYCAFVEAVRKIFHS